MKKIEALDKHRELQREKMDSLLQKKKETEREIKELEVVLEELDERLDKLEEECLPGAAHRNSTSTDNNSPQQTQPTVTESSMQFSDEVLTDPTTQTQQIVMAPRSAAAAIRPGRVSLDTQLTEPSSQLLSPIMDDEIENQVPFDYRVPSNNFARSSGSVGQLEFKTVPPKKKKAPPTNTNIQREIGPMDRFLASSSSSARAYANPSPEISIVTTPAAARSSATNVATSGPPASSHASTDRFHHDHFPWSAQIKNLLQNTFRIKQFREHQKEVINCTLSGQDVFVLMRTGGGKSLTYQLPALFEGRGRGQSGKVTFVVSPLLSLIKVRTDSIHCILSF